MAPSTARNRASTSSIFVASHLKAVARVSAQSASSLWGLREASATRIPFCDSSRASDALSPDPAPTMSSLWKIGCFGSDINNSSADHAARHDDNIPDDARLTHRHRNDVTKVSSGIDTGASYNAIGFEAERR